MENVARHNRALAIAIRNGNFTDTDEITERLEIIAESAETYAAYLGRYHPSVGRDPVLRRERAQRVRVPLATPGQMPAVVEAA